MATAVQAAEKIEADPENGRYFTFEEVQGKGDLKGQMVGRVEFTDANGTVTLIKEYVAGEDPNDMVDPFEEYPQFVGFMELLPFDLDFKGGSVDELLDAAQKGYIRSLEQTPEALRAYTLVGKATFKSYHIGSELNLRFPSISARCISLTDLGYLLEVMLPDDSNNWVGTRRLFGAEPGQVIGAHFYIETDAKTSTAIFNMADVRLASDAQAHQAVVAAMEAAWQATSNRAIAATVSYHTPTNLLIVNGLPRELNDARQVFRALQTMDSAKQTELEDLKASVLSLQEEISKLRKAK